MSTSSRVLNIIFALLATLLFQTTSAQTANVTFKVFPACSDKNDQRNNLEDLDISFFIDSKPVRSTGAMFAEGAHYMRVEVKLKDEYKAKNASFLITKVEWMRCTGAEALQTAVPNSKEATMIVNIDKSTDRNPCYKAMVYIDRCAGEKMEDKEAKIKIITTATKTSGIKSEPYTNMAGYEPTDQVSVAIGGREVKIDKDGTGFLRIPAGKHKLKYDWKGGNVSYAGPASMKISKSNQTVPLPTISNKFGYDHQIDLELPQLYSGTGNLYDFEIRLNMGFVPKGGRNEVRVVAVQPEVSAHKAGTPENTWIPVTKDMVLQEGDEISCDPDGAATLQFADMSTVVVKNTTQLKIASFFTEGGVVKTEILLKMGEVAAKVHKSEATKSDFRIQSPGDGGSVRGTTFSFSYDPQTKTNTVKVEEGIVEMKPSNAAVSQLVKAGQQYIRSQGNVAAVTPFTGQIDFALKGKRDVAIQKGNISGKWQVTQGSYKGTLTLRQSGTNLSGEILWANHQKGTIISGSIFGGSFILEIAYDGDLRGNYTGKLDETETRIIEGRGLSNKGTEAVWSAVRQK